MARASEKAEYGYESTFPKNLRTLMEERKINQETLAKFCGVQRQSISQWKDGNTRPDIQSLMKIATFFDVSTDWLLGLSDNRTTDQATKELCETLGLSDLAIDLLKRSKKSEKQLMQNLINTLAKDHLKACEEDSGRSSFIVLLSDFFAIANANDNIYIDISDDGVVSFLRLGDIGKETPFPSDEVIFPTKIKFPSIQDQLTLADYALLHQKDLILQALTDYSVNRKVARAIAANEKLYALQNAQAINKMLDPKGESDEDS